jgi:hypothetical protein
MKENLSKKLDSPRRKRGPLWPTCLDKGRHEKESYVTTNHPPSTINTNLNMATAVTQGY